MSAQLLLSAVIIVVGVWFELRGIVLKSGPRIISGLGIIAIGLGHLLGASSMLGTTLLAVGLMLIVASFYWMRTQSGRIVRPTRRRQR